MPMNKTLIFLSFGQIKLVENLTYNAHIDDSHLPP